LPPAALGSGLPPRPTPAAAGDGLPALCPRVRLINTDHPDPGVIFLAPFALSSTLFSNTGDLMIVDNRGQPLFWRHSAHERPLDFTPLADGRLAYIGTRAVYLLDSTYTLVDSFTTGNGYPIDAHEFQLLPNGHAIVESYDPQPVPMDSIVSGGRNDAVV